MEQKIQRDAPSAEITSFLLTTATEGMGLSRKRQLQKRAEKVTEILQRWRRVIAERPPTA